MGLFQSCFSSQEHQVSIKGLEISGKYTAILTIDDGNYILSKSHPRYKKLFARLLKKKEVLLVVRQRWGFDSKFYVDKVVSCNTIQEFTDVAKDVVKYQLGGKNVTEVIFKKSRKSIYYLGEGVELPQEGIRYVVNYRMISGTEAEITDLRVYIRPSVEEIITYMAL
jgi:hypothetical protein